MNIRTLKTIGSAAIACLFASCNAPSEKPASTPMSATAQPAAITTPLTVEESAEVTVTAKVKSINHTTREVTLQDAAGRTTSFIAGPQVQRLHEVAVGDDVTARYVVSLTAELRPPTADEVANPIAAVEVVGRSSKVNAPAAGAILGVRVVTTVEAIDLPNMRVTLRGPMGDSTTFRARNPENVKKLHLGDTIVMTYVEALGIALNKMSGQ